MTLIGSASRLASRIEEYCAEAETLTKRMSFVRAWYAIRREDGWQFGPSKFVGYDNLSPKQYLERGDLDGRDTERELPKWADLVEQGDPKFDELHSALKDFCASYRKTPNSRARVSVVKDNH